MPPHTHPPRTPPSRPTAAALRSDPAAIRRLFESGEYPYETRMRNAPYEAHMLELQRELLKAQRWVEETGQRIVMLFEGRDAAGKGGTIKRFTEHMNPRTARVVALQKPTERERTQWYFQRYIAHAARRRRNRAVRPLLVQPRRRRARDGVLHAQRLPGIHAPVPGVRADAGPLRHSTVQILVLGQPRGTAPALRGPRDRSAEAMEAVADRPRLAGQMGRLHRGEGGDVLLHRHRRRALDDRQGRRQEARPAELRCSTSCSR